MNEYQQLKNAIDGIQHIKTYSPSPVLAEFKAWKSNTERLIIKLYGEGSIEHTNFSKIQFLPPKNINENLQYFDFWGEGLKMAKLTLENYLDDFKDNQDEEKSQLSVNFRKVFIVHGHDGELKHAVARMIEKQDNLKAIILSEQINPGKTIIEKIEENSDVAGAICLFTADDLGRAKADTEEKPRARQNVVFEAGYFMGKLGRDHVVMICEDGVEIPGDLSGVVYTGKNHWEVEMLKALKVMGYNIDMNKLLE